MHRDRIRVRPAGSSGAHLSSLAPSSSSRASGASSELYRDSRMSAPLTADGPFAPRHAQPRETPFGGYEEPSSGVWRYFSRIGRLMSETVGGVFAMKRPRAEGVEEADAAAGSSSSSDAQKPALASPAVPPNTPYLATAPGYAMTDGVQSSAYGDAGVVRTADTIERRGPRRGDLPQDAPPPPPPPQAPPQPRGGPMVRPTSLHPAVPVRDTPSYQITINQYFTQPARDPLPYILPYTAPAVDSRRSIEYPSRPSLLKLSARLPAATATAPAQRPRVAATWRSAADEPDKPVLKAAKTADSSEASQQSFSNALSAIPAGSPENSLTVPIAPLASARLFSKPATATSDAGANAPAAAAKPGEAKSAAAPLFGAKPAAASAPTKPLLFGATPAGTPAAAPAPPAAPAFGAPNANSFVKPGPAAVMPDDDGFAPNADSDDDNGEGQKKTASESAAPARPAFSFNASVSAPAFGVKPPASAAAPANPFTFGVKPPAAAAGAAAAVAPAAPTPAPPAAPAFGALKTNSFVKPGPAAVMPDDDGFAPNADSDDDKADNQKKAGPASAAPARPAFGFAASGGASLTFGAPSAASPSGAAGAAPANPFSFAKPAAPAAPAAPAFGAPRVNSFVRPGPPAVIPSDEGFAPNADSDDDKADDQKKAKTEGAAPAKPMFSFSVPASTPAFGAKPATATGAPANPFSFSANASAPAFGSSAAPSFSFGNPK